MLLVEIRQGFIDAGIPEELVDEVLESYTEAKRRFHLGDHRPNEVEGGRFSEAVFRVLQHACSHPVTKLGKSLPKVDDLLVKFENATGRPDSIRVHIPRTLKLVYDIRNKRNVAHLGDGIDPNLQDATLVVGNMDWVMAELVRLYHAVGPDEAQKIIENLVTREVPAIQEIDGHPVILSDLQPKDQAMLLMYRAGAAGATLDELARWLRTPRKGDLMKRVVGLDKKEKLLFVHPQTQRIFITTKGSRYVETKRLAQPV